MIETRGHQVSHPVLTRRTALQAGSIGLMGLGISEVAALRAMAKPAKSEPTKSVLFIFLTGGLAHQDSFDMKPDAPDSVRGEFNPIATRTPGLQICEHLPLLAERSEQYALVRTIGTDSSGHEVACHMLLTGRLDLPPQFENIGKPSPYDWPSIPALTTYATRGRNNLPPAIVLPQPSVNEVGRYRPGQYAARLGSQWEAWHLEMAARCQLGNGACPNCFRFDGSPFEHEAKTIFDTPMLTLPEGGPVRMSNRVELLKHLDPQIRRLEQTTEVARLDRFQQQAISLLADPKTKQAFNVENADPKTLERYGKNKFGLSLLMAYRLIAAGVNLVQVNLGKNSSWDTHAQNFVNLKNNLLPYTDQAVSALLDDLAQSGLLETTLVVMTGEFGRTPKINKNAGRDHWGPVMTSLFAGAGVRGGNVIGKTDKIAAYPVGERQTPADVAATIYQTLGIPRSARWTEVDGRPHNIYHGEPIATLL